MKTIGTILRKCWLKMIVIFFAVIIIAFGIIRINQDKEEKIQKENLTVGVVLKFDISSYTYLGDGTASIYDYVSVWQNEDLISDYIELLDQGKAISILNPDWDYMNVKDKKTWINENIKLQRLATSTMYNITYKCEATEENVSEKIEAAKEVIDAYVDYAGSIARLSDKDIQYNVEKEILNEEPVFTQKEKKTNVLLELGISAVLGILVTGTYLGFKVIKNEKK